MSNYDNENRGAIWPNKEKKSDKHPDFTGRINVDGVEYWVSAWKKAPDANPKAPSLSFSIKRKDDVHAQGMEQAREAVQSPNNHGGKTAADFEDDIPF